MDPRLKALLALPENKRCADCWGLQPRFASVRLAKTSRLFARFLLQSRMQMDPRPFLCWKRCGWPGGVFSRQQSRVEETLPCHRHP